MDIRDRILMWVVIGIMVSFLGVLTFGCMGLEIKKTSPEPCTVVTSDGTVLTKSGIKYLPKDFPCSIFKEWFGQPVCTPTPLKPIEGRKVMAFHFHSPVPNSKDRLYIVLIAGKDGKTESVRAVAAVLVTPSSAKTLWFHKDAGEGVRTHIKTMNDRYNELKRRSALRA